MMKFKHLLSVAALSMLGSTAFAQKNLIKRVATPTAPGAMEYRATPAKLTGLEEAQPNSEIISVPPSDIMVRSANVDEIAGNTTYDLQTNGCEQARVYTWPNGEVSMGWTTAPLTQPESSGFPGRGSGYNRRSAWTAGTVVDSRVESTRTGFTNYVVNSNGTEHLFSHKANGAGKYLIHHAYRDGSAATWTETAVPTTTPNGQLWCKAAADGNTIHLIAVTTPTGTFGGTVYRGMDGHVLYYRSKDAGVTWDIVDGVIPGLDSTFYVGNGGDSYTITARDGTVAIGIFESWSDTKVFKSTDGGDTWSTIVVNDFPLDNYITNTPYEPSDVGGPAAGAPNNDPYAIFTNDEKGTIAIDAVGSLHVVFGGMWVRDSIWDDAGSNYYPGTNSMVYWSEADAANLYEITGSLDLNGDSVLNITSASIQGIEYNSSGLCSMPTLAADDEGGIYLAYSAIVENLFSADGKSYRHVYMMKSNDFGLNWTEPLDVQYFLITDGDSTLAFLTEAVYPFAEKVVGEEFRFQYQRDFVPGAALRKEGNQDDETSEIMYFGSDRFVGAKNIANGLSFGLVPNPATESTAVNFNLAQTADTQVQLFDLNGSAVRSLQQGQLAAGPHQVNLATNNLPNGIYFVRVQAGQQIGVQRLVVLNR
jgi:hypothetical protein